MRSSCLIVEANWDWYWNREVVSQNVLRKTISACSVGYIHYSLHRVWVTFDGWAQIGGSKANISDMMKLVIHLLRPWVVKVSRLLSEP